MVSFKTGVLLRLATKMTAKQLDLDKTLEEKLGIFAERIGIVLKIFIIYKFLIILYNKNNTNRYFKYKMTF